MITITKPPNHIILGTNGEDAIIAGLRLLQQQGTPEQAREAIHLLRHLGVISHQPRSYADWLAGGL